jgi:hypothetical protein
MTLGSVLRRKEKLQGRRRVIVVVGTVLVKGSCLKTARLAWSLTLVVKIAQDRDINFTCVTTVTLWIIGGNKDSRPGSGTPLF